MRRIVALVLVGCWSSEPGEVVPEVQATVEPSTAPPEPKSANDVGPGGLSQAAVEAYTGVFPKGRRVRCEVPAALSGLGGSGILSAVWLGPKEEALRGPSLLGSWFAGVVPTSEGKGLVFRDGRAVARLAWSEASTGAWSACTLEPAERVNVIGLVQTVGKKEVAGAVVRGCEEGVVGTTNKLGRFELSAVADRDCPFVAIVQDEGGLGRSEPRIVRSERTAEPPPPKPGETDVPSRYADVIVEITLTPERVAVSEVAEKSGPIHGIKQRALANGLAAEVEGFKARVAEAALTGEAGGVADGWIAELEARLARQTQVVEGLGRGDVEGLRAYWLADF